jgi:hypothetical protein
MVDEDEANELAGRPPDEIAGRILDLDIGLVIDGAECREEALVGAQQVAELAFSSVLAGSSWSAARSRRRDLEGHSIAAHTGDEMMSLLEERSDDLAAGIVGVGDEEDRTWNLLCDFEEEIDQAVEQRTSKLLGRVDHPLVDACCERDGGHTRAWGPYELCDGLEGVALDPLGLGVIGGLLMQFLDPGHLPTLLGDLDAIGQADAGSADLEGLEVTLAEADPEGSERAQLKRFGMEVIQQTLILLGL